jgi:ribosomal protein L22
MEFGKIASQHVRISPFKARVVARLFQGMGVSKHEHGESLPARRHG